jgi:predicted dehydrogenase
MKPDRIYNISIAGCGKVAHLHAQAIQNIPNARLAGVWSRTPKTAKDFASHYKTRSYPEIAPMVFENETDLVIVCTPHPFHKQPAVEAAEAGANVLVEKPLASDLRDCDAIINACKVRYAKLGVISQRRWYSPVMRVREAIDKGKIGKPVLATITMLGWRDKAYYDSDVWFWSINRRISSILCFGSWEMLMKFMVSGRTLTILISKLMIPRWQ